ncbi:hypothetical protein G1K46_08415 [Tenacibaculum finnmarkense]|uniref:hypothetical protein n=1 Tax=Tenacibaculum finnmarkense TaxID=2781243 RepID=UPI001E5E56EE|nr:hypothetical protein [Tenacibaculum finnmarkense]MCD8400316.1 hypothetical protein [Tenacibaculum finnmarkense genomovar ulcerans]MCG8762753.1 hypothetical protein [Tenacibaculum finnmarkense]MCG8788130.1 hypothetical protein [Tenacibaculum finnmarkense]
MNNNKGVFKMNTKQGNLIFKPTTLQYLQSGDFEQDVDYLHNREDLKNSFYKRLLNGLNNNADLIFTDKISIEMQKETINKIDAICKSVTENLELYNQIIQLLPQVKSIYNSQKPCKIITLKQI